MREYNAGLLPIQRTLEKMLEQTRTEKLALDLLDMLIDMGWKAHITRYSATRIMVPAGLGPTGFHASWSVQVTPQGLAFRGTEPEQARMDASAAFAQLLLLSSP